MDLQIDLLNITSSIQGAKWPASKQDLIKAAKDSGADEDTVKALESLPDKLYTVPQEVSQALGQNKQQ